MRCLTNRFGAILPLLITQSGPQWESILPTPHRFSPLSLLRCRESMVNPMAPLTPIRFMAGATELLTNPSNADPLVLPVLMTLKWLFGLTSYAILLKTLWLEIAIPCVVEAILVVVALLLEPAVVALLLTALLFAPT